MPTKDIPVSRTRTEEPSPASVTEHEVPEHITMLTASEPFAPGEPLAEAKLLALAILAEGEDKPAARTMRRSPLMSNTMSAP